MATAMRRTAVILASIFVAALFRSSGAFAQDSGPTDADLKAAYCLNAIEDFDSWTHVCTNPAELAKKKCHDDQTNVERLKDYLGVRGYLFGEREFDAGHPRRKPRKR